MGQLDTMGRIDAMGTGYYFDHDAPKFKITNTILEEGALHDNNFSLFHLNTRSLSKKATNVVDYISILNHDFDVICFTETWFNNIEESNLIDLDNYDKIDCIRDDRIGGGATIFINSKHNFIQRLDLKINVTDCDSTFIEIPDRKIIIGLTNPIMLSTTTV